MRSISPVGNQQPPFCPSGSADIDAARRAVAASPTGEEDVQRRALLLYVWLGALQQQGADTRPFSGVDRRYHPLEAHVARASDGERASLIGELTSLVDVGFSVMETIQTQLVEHGPIATPREGDPADPPQGGDMDADWPMFQGNIHNTGYTDRARTPPRTLAWKFPVGLGWYARPVVEDGRVYVASPGMHATSLLPRPRDGRRDLEVHPEHPAVRHLQVPRHCLHTPCSR